MVFPQTTFIKAFASGVSYPFPDCIVSSACQMNTANTSITFTAATLLALLQKMSGGNTTEIICMLRFTQSCVKRDIGEKRYPSPPVLPVQPFQSQASPQSGYTYPQPHAPGSLYYLKSFA